MDTNLLVNTIVRLPNSRSRDSQDQETFLPSSTDNKIYNYDSKCLGNTTNTQIQATELKQDEMVNHAYSHSPVNAIARLTYPRSRDILGKETFLPPSVENQTCNYYTECLNHHLSLSALRTKGLSRSKMKW